MQLSLDAPLLIVTLDPWRDTPSSLLQQAEAWGLKHKQHFLSGEASSVNALLNSLSVPRERSPIDGDLVHPGLVYLIDREGLIAYSFNNPSVKWLTEAYKRLL